MTERLGVLVIVALCAYRLARIVSYDTITDPLRDWLWSRAYIGVREYDEFADVHRRSRVWAWIYGLASCIFCAGWWLALAMYLAWREWSWVRPGIVAVACAGLCALFARLDVGHAP